MEPQSTPANVIPLKPRYALFNPALRQQLADGVRPHTEKADEVVTAVEQVASTYIVATVRRLTVRWTEMFLNKVLG